MKPGLRLKKTHRTFAETVDRKVGARIAERRALAELTQPDLGMPMGVTAQQISRYEAGENRLDVATIISIARTLGCRAADLLQDFDGAQDSAPAPLSPEAVGIAKAVDGIKSSNLRSLLKVIADKIRAHERANKS